MPSLRFKGKVFVENLHLGVPFHELQPVRGKGLSERASLHENLIVEGDNLAALKALQPTCHGKVKCIYIDPPYNTGNEGWAYNDNVTSPMMQDWLGKVVDREDLTRHDKWCCMMLPRLKLLRELLRDDGAIFVSIDDNEVHRLRCLMDEVFGEENFLFSAAWQKRVSPDGDEKLVTSVHDHIVTYGRNREQTVLNRFPRTDEANARYTNPDNDHRGPWTSSDLTRREYRAHDFYPITLPSGREVTPAAGRSWSVPKGEFTRLVNENRIWFGHDGNVMPRRKRFLSEVSGGIVPTSWWNRERYCDNQNAKQEMRQIFPEQNDVFSTPKPSGLIKRILQIATDKDSIVLDSFAGSGTTAQAVLALNKEDGGNRRFVLIECEDYVDSITAERVRRVMRGVPAAKDAALKAGLGGAFSYFKLGRPMRQESLLDPSKLPSYEKLAGYIFFTATGEEFEPERIDKQSWFIGSSRLYDVFLIYEPDVEKLKNMALTLREAEALPAGERKKLVFAPTKYLDREFLHRYDITFQQLPFQIYETVEKLDQ